MKKQQLVISFILMGVLLAPFFAFATPTYVEDTITNITKWIFTIALALAILMYVVAGFLWMSDAGNVERVKIAKSIIISTTIGLVVILMASGIKSIVESLVVTK